MREERLETLITERNRSYGFRARLGARLAHLRASGSSTRMFTWGRYGRTAELHGCHIAECFGNRRGSNPPLGPTASPLPTPPDTLRNCYKNPLTKKPTLPTMMSTEIASRFKS